MSDNPDDWVYGDYAPNSESHDLVGLKARWVCDCLPQLAAPIVLDYGVGEGKYLHLIRKVKPAAKLVGVDVRPVRSAIDFDFHLVESDAGLPFPDNYFDVIVSCDVLEHVDDVESSLSEIYRVLRQGGSFIGFVPLEGGFGAYAFFRLFDRNIYRDTKDHKYAYRNRQMIDLLSSRFSIVDLSYSYHIIGATLDAVFFASFKLPYIGRRLQDFWRGQENAVYRSAASKPSIIGYCVGVANKLAYWESVLLKRISFGAAGLHFHVKKPDCR